MNIVYNLCCFYTFSRPVGVNVFAQNVIQQTNQTGFDKTQAAMNETGNAAGNIIEGLDGVASKTGNAAGNIIEGLDDAVNEIGEALSNTTKGAIEGIEDVINGSI